MRGKLYAALGTVFLVITVILALSLPQVAGGEYTIDINVQLYEPVEVQGHTIWVRAPGEEVQVRTFLEWDPNNRWPEDEQTIVSDANGVARAIVDIDRAGEYTVWISWLNETEGRVLEIGEDDNDMTYYVGVELRQEWDPWWYP